MNFMSIDYIKLHSRIDYDCEDELLEEFADAAEEAACGILGRGKTVEEMVTSLTEDYGKIPASVYVYCQMVVEDLYNNRSTRSNVQQYALPDAEKLIKPYVKL